MSQNLQPLDQLVSASSFPEEMQFLTTPISTLLNNFLVVEYHHQSSFAFNSISVFLVLRTNSDISFEIPGTGMRLILNPGITPPGSPTATDFPINVNVNFKDQGIWEELDVMSFSNGFREVYDRLVDYFSLSESYLLERILNLNYADSNAMATAINGTYTGASLNANINTSDPITDQIEEIITKIEADTTLQGIPVDVYDVSFDLQIGSQPFVNQWDKMQELFQFQLNEASAKDFILKNLLPAFSASLGVGVGLEFPRAILLPLEDDGTGKFVPALEPNKFKLDFNVGDLYYSSDGGFGFNELYTATLNPYPKAEIGRTGLKISFNQARLDLSKESNIPEAAADGRPNDFTGVFIDQASIELPDNFTISGGNVEIIGRNLLIGTGGISGRIGLQLKSGQTGSPSLSVSLGSFDLSFNAFSLTFQQNSIIESNIVGTLTLPSQFEQGGSSATIAIQAAFANNGDFSLTASSATGIDIEIPNVLTIKIYELSLGELNDKFFIKINGAIQITADPASTGDPLMDDFVPVPGIIIWEDGSLEIEGGRIPIPNALELKLGPTTISITAIDYGTAKRNDRNYSYFGFSGGLDMSPGGVDIQGNGIKYFYTTDDDPFDHFLELDQIGIDIHLPAHMDPSKAKVNINGFLSISNPQDNSGSANDESGNPSKEYMGSVAFLLRLKEGAEISGGAAMRLRPKEPSFVVDAFMEMNKPIPLGTTGLGIFGFRGLIGQRFVPSKSAANISENSTWWNYYKAPVEGVNVGKFGQKDGFSIGAGLALATSEDDGYATYGDIARLAIYT